MLWIDLNGRIACDAHLGAEGSAMRARYPARKRLATTLTTWQKLPDAEFTKDYGISLVCERCKYAHP